MRVKSETTDWLTVAVGRCDPLTKMGKLRKRLVIRCLAFEPEDRDTRAHRVKVWGQRT